jgi:hypothetical protein
MGTLQTAQEGAVRIIRRAQVRDPRNTFKINGFQDMPPAAYRSREMRHPGVSEANPHSVAPILSILGFQALSAENFR